MSCGATPAKRGTVKHYESHSNCRYLTRTDEFGDFCNCNNEFGLLFCLNDDVYFKTEGLIINGSKINVTNRNGIYGGCIFILMPNIICKIIGDNYYTFIFNFRIPNISSALICIVRYDSMYNDSTTELFNYNKIKLVDIFYKYVQNIKNKITISKEDQEELYEIWYERKETLFKKTFKNLSNIIIQCN